MSNANSKVIRRNRRKRGIRKNVFGTAGRPRLTVFRSLKHVYAQVINDLDGRTIASASTVDKGVELSSGQGGNCDAAKTVGATVARRAMDAGCSEVVFDRNGFRYHGRVKALADAAREAGLKF